MKIAGIRSRAILAARDSNSSSGSAPAEIGTFASPSEIIIKIARRFGFFNRSERISCQACTRLSENGVAPPAGRCSRVDSAIATLEVGGRINVALFPPNATMATALLL